MGNKEKIKRKYSDQPEKNPVSKKFKIQFQGSAHTSVKTFSFPKRSKMTTENENCAGSAQLEKSRRLQRKKIKRKKEKCDSDPLESGKKLCLNDRELSGSNSNELKPTDETSGTKRKTVPWKNRSGAERKRKWAMNNKLKREKRLECKNISPAKVVTCSSETVSSDKNKSKVTTQGERKSSKGHEKRKGLPSRQYFRQKKHKNVNMVGSNSTHPSQLSVASKSPEKQKTVEASSPPPEVSSISSNWKHLQTLLKNTLQPSLPKKHQQIKKLKKTSSKEDISKDPSKDPMVDDKRSETVSSPQIWFDDVDDILIETMKRTEEHKRSNEDRSGNKSDDRLVKTGSYPGVTKIVAMDCEMVGVGEGGKESVLARVSIVNQFGHCIYDKYVKPLETVTDYRTHVSGIRPQDLKKGEEFYMVQKDVSEIIKGRLLVGHAIENDLKVLFLDHPRKRIRDTSRYKPFRKLFDGRKPALKKLSDKLLSVKVQVGEHNSVQDAQATMRLYTVVRREWEKDINEKRRKRTVPHKHTKTDSVSAS